MPLVVELEIGKGNVADHGVDAAFGQLRVAEVLDADVGLGVQGLGDAARYRIHLHADEAGLARGVAHEVAGAAARFQDRGLRGTPRRAMAS